MAKNKNRWGNVITSAIKQGSSKGLRINKNLFLDGWSITLPNGSVYKAESDSDMVKYVRGY